MGISSQFHVTRERVLVTPLLSRYTFINKFCPKEVRSILKINTHSDDMTSPKFNRTAVQVEAAQAKISPHVTKASIEKVTLESAHGRTLAETIHAPHPYPFSVDQVWMVMRLSAVTQPMRPAINRSGCESLMKFHVDTRQIYPLLQVRPRE